jgi:hypothetical protein
MPDPSHSSRDCLVEKIDRSDGLLRRLYRHGNPGEAGNKRREIIFSVKPDKLEDQDPYRYQGPSLLFFLHQLLSVMKFLSCYCLVKLS